jgi:L-alanine-DL-glutamate epimerase-like enolase superfamily enzyme
VDAVGSHNAAWGLRELAVGQDALEIGPLWDRMRRGSIYYGREGVGASAIGGVEIALWDLVGQATGSPIHVMLGGPFRSDVNAYASLLTRDTPEANVEVVTRLAREGYTAFKLGGGVLGRDADHDESIIAAVRGAAPGAQLMIDLAYEWGDPWTALRRARRLEPYDLGWIEEPLMPDDLDAYSWLAARSPVPIAAGEVETTEAGLLRLLEREAVHVIQPDVTRCGGFGVTTRVARAAEQRGVRCVPHVWKTGINKAAALHIAAAMPRVDLIECCVEPNPLQESLTLERFEPKEGRIAVPVAPGLGVTIDQDTVARYRADG